MRKHSLWLLTGSLLCAFGAVGALHADKSNTASSGFQQQWLDAATRQLKLTDTQKQEIGTIQTECQSKAKPIIKQLSAVEKQEHQAMKQILTAEQVKNLPEALHAAWDQEWQRMAVALGLTADQRQRIGKIKEEYRPKFHELFTQKGENTHEQMHELKMAFMAKVGTELTDEQRVRLPYVLHSELLGTHEKAMRQQFETHVSEALGLSADQKSQIKKIDQQYEPQLTKPVTELRQLIQDEQARVDKVLTAEQRSKLQELRKPKAKE